MARPKRGRESITSHKDRDNSKRQRVGAATEEPATENQTQEGETTRAQPQEQELEEPSQTTEQPDSEVYYLAKSILKEKAGKYLIDWEQNSQTGEVYQPTWEPKENANITLVRDWVERKQAAKDRRDSSVKRGKRRPRKSDVERSETPVDQEPKKTRRRPRKSEPGDKEATEEAESEIPSRTRRRPRKSPVAEGSDSEEDAPVTRKRGRLRKSDEHNEETEATESPAPKRRRGRPRESEIVEPPDSTQDYIPSGYQDDSTFVEQPVSRTRRATRSGAQSSPARSSSAREEESTSKNELPINRPEDESLIASQPGRGSDLHPLQIQRPDISPKVVVQQRSDFNREQYTQYLTSQVCDEIQESPQAHFVNSSAGDTQYPSNYQDAEQLLQPLKFEKDAIVPDSQDGIADDSYVPSTQTATQTFTQTPSGEVSTGLQDASESNNPTQSASLEEETDPIEEFTTCGASAEEAQEPNPEVSTEDDTSLGNATNQYQRTKEAEQRGPEPGKSSTQDDSGSNGAASQFLTAQEEHQPEQPVVANELSTQKDSHDTTLEHPGPQTVQAPVEEQRPNPADISNQDEYRSNSTSNHQDNPFAKSSSEYWQPAQPQFRIPDSHSQEYQSSASEQHSGSQGININASSRSATLLAEPEILIFTVEAQSAELVLNQEEPVSGDLDAAPASPAVRETKRQASPAEEAEVSPRTRESQSPTFDPDQTSSSIPQPNSHLPETLGTNHPPRLDTPSDPPETPKAQVSNHSTQSDAIPEEEERPAWDREDSAEIRSREEIKALLANVSSLMERVKSSPANAGSGIGTRSPSVIPPNPPESPMLPQKTLGPSRLSVVDRAAADEKEVEEEDKMQVVSQSDRSSSPGVLLEEPIVAEQEYLIGVPFQPHQGDQYRDVINYHKSPLKVIPDFLSGTDRDDDALAARVEEFLNRLRRIQDHMELDFPEQLTQTPSQDLLEPAWINAEGSKFEFFGRLVDAVRDHYLHLVVLSSPGPVTDMLETHLRDKRVLLYRTDNLGMTLDYEPVGKITVRIVPTSEEGLALPIRFANLVVSFDSRVDLENERVREIRQDVSDPTKLAPVLTPVVANGLDHIERCIAPTVQGRERSRLIVKLTSDLKNEAGKSDYYIKTDEVIEAVETQWANHPRTWDLPQIGSIKPYVQFEESLSQFRPSSSLLHGTMESVTGTKRMLDDTNEMVSPKKQRLTPQPGTVNPADITHISDSLANTALPASSNDAAYTTDEIRTLEDRLRIKESQVQDLEAAIEDRDNKYDEVREELHAIRADRDAARAELVLSTTKLIKLSTDLAASKDEISTLRADLATARTALSTSTVPEIAAFEALRQERDDAIAKTQRLETTRAALARDNEFYTSQYQTASASAAESAKALRALEKCVAPLEQQASGEAARARAISLNTADNAWKGDNERLRIEAREKDALLKRLWEENNRLKGSRGVGTRAGSVPRSPRVGANGAGSRSGSPAPGELGGRGNRVDRLRTGI